jgi:hypothetical protein
VVTHRRILNIGQDPRATQYFAFCCSRIAARFRHLIRDDKCSRFFEHEVTINQFRVIPQGPKPVTLAAMNRAAAVVIAEMACLLGDANVPVPVARYYLCYVAVVKAVGRDYNALHAHYSASHR